MNARSVQCPYCKAGRGHECRSVTEPHKKVFSHPARIKAAKAKEPQQWKPSPTPWRVLTMMSRNGDSVKIIDANGVTIATMQGAGREANANAIVRSVNPAKHAEAA